MELLNWLFAAVPLIAVVGLALWFVLAIRRDKKEYKRRVDEFLDGMPEEFVRIYREKEREND